MRILNIIAQKPYATGSGIYFVETIKEFEKLGHDVASVFACYENETFDLGTNTKQYKLVFNKETVPFYIFGMSDTMPYESSRYSEMTDEAFEIWKNKFLETIDNAVSKFNPDLIICHHLYLLTAIVREKYKNFKVYGICHNTDIRQFIKTELKREYIRKNIKSLDRIFAPTDYHKNLLCKLYDVDKNKVNVIGIGYNKSIFTNKLLSRDKYSIRFLYVGKVSKKKGLMVLLNAFKNIENSNIYLDIVGGAGDKDEYDGITEIAKGLKINVNFLGKKTQNELASIYNNADYLVMPTLFDAVPLTMIEAMACGCKVIISDLPGLKDYIGSNISGEYVRYVEMPKMYNADETSAEEISKFTKRFTDAIIYEINRYDKIAPNVNLANVSWEHVSKTITGSSEGNVCCKKNKIWKILSIFIALLIFATLYYAVIFNKKSETMDTKNTADISKIFDSDSLILGERTILPATYSIAANSDKLLYIKNDFKNTVVSLDDNFSFKNGDYKSTSVVKDGIKCYFDNNGDLIKDVRPYVKFDKYAISVNRKAATTTVYGYDDTKNKLVYVPIVSFPCSLNYKRTRIGEYLTSDKYEWHLMYFDYYAKYCTRFDGNILFHSVPYNSKCDDDLVVEDYNGILDKMQSSGCVRLRAKDAYYIYKTMPKSTVVVVYDGKLDSPFGRPAFDKIIIDRPIATSSITHYYDPTDPAITNEW